MVQQLSNNNKMKKNVYKKPKAEVVNLPRLLDVGPGFTSKEEEPGSLDLKFEEESEEAPKG